MKIKEIYDFLDFAAPFNTAAEWDNCGLSVGSLDADVKKVVIALDVTSEIIDFALLQKAELVITHHPLIFHPVKSVESDTLLSKAVKSGITFISSHTCLDKAVGGVNDCLARKVGLKNTEFTNVEFLKIGETEACTAEQFAKVLKTALGGAVRYNDSGKPIQKVAFCSGSGGDFTAEAAAVGADALLTGDASYRDFLNAAQNGISLFAAGHYETENPVCEHLYNLLSEQFEGMLEAVIYDGKTPIITY